MGHAQCMLPLILEHLLVLYFPIDIYYLYHSAIDMQGGVRLLLGVAWRPQEEGGERGEGKKKKKEGEKGEGKRGEKRGGDL